MNWKRYGQIHLNHDDEFELKIWKPEADFKGWFWSCLKLGVKKQYLDIIDDDEAKQAALKLVLEKVEERLIEIAQIKVDLEHLLK